MQIANALIRQLKFISNA